MAAATWRYPPKALPRTNFEVYHPPIATSAVLRHGKHCQPAMEATTTEDLLSAIRTRRSLCTPQNITHSKMGSSQSKQSKCGGKDNSRSKTTSPNQEKHNSADSKTPLTRRQADLSIPRSPSPNSPYTNAEQGRPSHGREDSAPRNSTAEIQVDEQEGHSNVTRPPPPPQLRRLSELIDPHELTIDSNVRSPSGNLLAVEQFLVHPDRPRSIRERQEQIREKVRAASRLGQELEDAGEGKSQNQTKKNKTKKRKRVCLLCGCFSSS